MIYFKSDILYTTLLGGIFMSEKKKFECITDSELLYMEVIWNHPEGINSEELYKIGSTFTRSRTGNFLHLLVKKGYAKYEKVGRHFNYYPTLTKEEYNKLAAKNEVVKLLPTDTSMVQMIAGFCGKTNLTQQQYTKINKFLEQLEKDLQDESGKH